MERARDSLIKHKPAGSHTRLSHRLPPSSHFIAHNMVLQGQEGRWISNLFNPPKGSWQRKSEPPRSIGHSCWVVRNNGDGWRSEQGTDEKVHVPCPHHDHPSHHVLPILLFVTEIIKKVKKPPPLCRPNIAPELAPLECIQVMKQCWGEAPERRPTFEEVFHKVGEQSSRFNPLFVLSGKVCFISSSEPLNNDWRSPRALVLPLLLRYFMVCGVWIFGFVGQASPGLHLVLNLGCHVTTTWGVKQDGHWLGVFTFSVYMHW